MKSEKILLIDADMLAFRTSAGCEKRSVIVKHKPTGKVRIFDTRTQFRERLDEKGTRDQEPDYEFEDIYEPTPISHCLRSIKVRIKTLTELSRADKVEIYLSGDKNFRTELLLPTQYKSNRTDLYRPTHLDAAKEYLIERHGAVKAWEIEADDILSVRGYEEISKGNSAIIATNDKDTLQGDGLGMLDYTVENPEICWIPTGVGEVSHNGKKVVGHSWKFLAYQLLVGDMVDCYKPTELSKSRYGAKSAVKDLALPSTEAEVCNKIVEIYKEFYPEPFDYTAWNGVLVEGATWETMLDLYFKCAWMKRSWDDPSDWREEFKKRGWNGELV